MARLARFPARPREQPHDLGVLDLTIQRILRHSNVTTTRKSYIHREHQVTAAMGQLEAGIEAESRRAETAHLEAQNHLAEAVN
jgi:hypothetical protein